MGLKFDFTFIRITVRDLFIFLAVFVIVNQTKSERKNYFSIYKSLDETK